MPAPQVASWMGETMTRNGSCGLSLHQAKSSPHMSISQDPRRVRDCDPPSMNQEEVLTWFRTEVTPAFPTGLLRTAPIDIKATASAASLIWSEPNVHIYRSILGVRSCPIMSQEFRAPSSEQLMGQYYTQHLTSAWIPMPLDLILPRVYAEPGSCFQVIKAVTHRRSI